MAGRDDIYKYGQKTRFTSENQPTKSGRKPKIYNIAKKTYGISFEEFKEVVNYLMQCPKTKLIEISECEDTPIWMINVCRALHKDTGRGTMNTLRDIVAFMWGKEMAAKVDITTNGKDIIAPARTLTAEEARDYGLKLEEEY